MPSREAFFLNMKRLSCNFPAQDALKRAGRNRPVPQEYDIGEFLRCRAARGYRLNAKSSAGCCASLLKKMASRLGMPSMEDFN
jgi:hypothetical protein